MKTFQLIVGYIIIIIGFIYYILLKCVETIMGFFVEAGKDAYSNAKHSKEKEARIAEYRKSVKLYDSQGNLKDK